VISYCNRLTNHSCNSGRGLIHKFLGVGEMIGVMPTGVQKTADSLALAADCLVAGGKEKLFTPMYLIKAVKPKK
jgi:sterol 24-C-methyltransferase